MAHDPRAVIAPGSVIGILGGGQLGRMTVLAAARLGYRCHVFCPEADSVAADVAAAATIAPYEDIAAIASFADAVDVVTFEFENIPEPTLRALTDRRPVRPSPQALRVSQDRAIEKRFVNDIDIATAKWIEVAHETDLAAAFRRIPPPAILKSARLGYDGKGQVRIAPGDDSARAWAAAGGGRAVLEGLVDFERELSVIVARGIDGTVMAYPPVENHHVGGILTMTRAPAPVTRAVADDALGIATRIAAVLDLIGLLAVEMFLTRSGEILVNEIAPRPHNSGHWTIDACAVSQFEQFVRAVCGLPLGSTARHSDAVMTNLIGHDVDRWQNYIGQPETCLHLYGKRATRPGRKMGHVTRLYPIGAVPTED